MPAPILHVAPFLWSGAGRVISRLCTDQAAHRPVTLVTTGASGGLRDWPSYRRALRVAGVAHRRLDVFHRDAEHFWGAATRLTALLRELQPAVIHAHAGVPAALAAIARDRSGLRARLIAQMYSWGPNRAAWMDAQDAWAFSRADRVVCSAHAYRHLLAAHGVRASRMSYLPWGLDLAALPFQPRGGTAVEAPVIGFVGRIEPRKAQVALVEAFARLRRDLPAARLELVGPVADEDYARTLTATIGRLGVSTAVRVTGQVKDVTHFVRGWSLFASLSADEGQGLAVLEAMALGVPVAARRVAGIEDFLTAGATGWAIEPGGATASARALRAALDDTGAPAIVARARRLVERDYDWTTMRHRFDRIYHA
jgi:glycosyltransferase involved in cell wall biosynthesis